jgi:hypothetical protein
VQHQWRLAAFLSAKGWIRKDCQAITQLESSVTWLEDKLAASDNAMIAICNITGQTHTGKPRAYTALSQIDQIARKALA